MPTGDLRHKLEDAVPVSLSKLRKQDVTVQPKESLARLTIEDCSDCKIRLEAICCLVTVSQCTNVSLEVSARIEGRLKVIDCVSSDVTLLAHGDSILVDGCENVTVNVCPHEAWPIFRWSCLPTRETANLRVTYGPFALATGHADISAQQMPTAERYLPEQAFFIHPARDLAALISAGDVAREVPYSGLVCVSAACEALFEAREERIQKGRLNPVEEAIHDRIVAIISSFGGRPLEIMPKSEILPGRLHLGGHWDAQTPDALAAVGITHVINVAFADNPVPEGFYGERIKFTSLALLDEPDQSIMPHFDHIYEVMRKEIDAGGHVYIHCWAGMSRSASFALLYIMESSQCSVEEALLTLRRGRRIALPNVGFLRQLMMREHSRSQSPASSSS